MSNPCPVCGYKDYTGFGHPYGGNRTPPKTRWCTGQFKLTNEVIDFNEAHDDKQSVIYQDDE